MGSLPSIVSTIIFLVTLFVIFSEKINRTIAALAGATLMVVAGTMLGFYSEEDAIHSIDFETIGLLLGMMILVSMLETTGFFQYMAVWAGRLSKGRPDRLLVLLGAITTVLSMFLDNVTTVVLIAPVTILMSEILGISPIPFLIAEALLSNTGGVATLVGDPPNILIASATGFTFNEFLTHSLPIVAVAWVAALFLLRFMFRDELSKKIKNIDAVLLLDPDEALKDRDSVKRILIVLAGALLLFFLQELLPVTPAFIALSASSAALLWVRPSLRETLKQVEWNVLMFFVALFVLVSGLEHAGVLHTIADLVLQVGDTNPILLGLGVLWGVAILSALVDNIPITIALIPVIQDMATIGIATNPLWWALAFGAGFGGNATIIGSTANVVVASLSERTRTPIDSILWIKRGLPVMLVTCTIASILFVLLYPFLLR